MVKPAGSDVVGPAIAPDDPDATPDQVIGDAEQVLARPIQAVQATLEPGDALVLRAQFRLAPLRRAEYLGGQIGAGLLAQFRKAPPGKLQVPVCGQPETEAELG